MWMNLVFALRAILYPTMENHILQLPEVLMAIRGQLKITLHSIANMPVRNKKEGKIQVPLRFSLLF
jgi:hypothetical protein